MKLCQFRFENWSKNNQTHSTLQDKVIFSPRFVTNDFDFFFVSYNFRSVSTQIFVDEDRVQLISSSMWICLFLFEMFSVCYVCHKTKTEVIITNLFYIQSILEYTRTGQIRLLRLLIFKLPKKKRKKENTA